MVCILHGRYPYTIQLDCAVETISQVVYKLLLITAISELKYILDLIFLHTGWERKQKCDIRIG